MGSPCPLPEGVAKIKTVKLLITEIMAKEAAAAARVKKGAPNLLIDKSKGTPLVGPISASASTSASTGVVETSSVAEPPLAEHVHTPPVTKAARLTACGEPDITSAAKEKAAHTGTKFAASTGVMKPIFNKLAIATKVSPSAKKLSSPSPATSMKVSPSAMKIPPPAMKVAAAVRPRFGAKKGGVPKSKGTAKPLLSTA